jgi:hypothetical protein
LQGNLVTFADQAADVEVERSRLVPRERGREKLASMIWLSFLSSALWLSGAADPS